jgi:hypothetical protein
MFENTIINQTPWVSLIEFDGSDNRNQFHKHMQKWDRIVYGHNCNAIKIPYSLNFNANRDEFKYYSLTEQFHHWLLSLGIKDYQVKIRYDISYLIGWAFIRFTTLEDTLIFKLAITEDLDF